MLLKLPLLNVAGGLGAGQGGCRQCPPSAQRGLESPAALWATQHEQAKGVSCSPSALTPNHHLLGVAAPVGASLCSPSPPTSACTEGLVHFLPLPSIAACPCPLTA